MIEVFGIKLHAYGLFIGIGVVVAWEIALRLKKVDKSILDKLIVWLLVFGVVGARAYHVIDKWDYYSQNVIEIFYVWNGGLGIWGGLVGGLIGVYFFAKKYKQNFWTLSDGVVVGVPLAQAIGRLGNWANGELYGKNGEPLFAWEGGLNLVLFGILIYLYRLPRFARNDGALSGVYFVGYGVIRILLENFRDNSIIWRIGGIPTAIIFGIISVIIGMRLIINKKI